jgi:hypothetical protein
MAPKAKAISLGDLPTLPEGADWTRLQGLKEALPTTIQRVPYFHVTVSGSIESPRVETKHGVSGDIAMAWDVWRHDPKDAPFIFNKDHYFLTKKAGRAGDEFQLHGPFRKGEPDHWAKEIAAEYADCDLLVMPSGSLAR